MKRFLTLFVSAAMVLSAGCGTYDDSGIKSELDGLKNRVAALEVLCERINGNVSSLQTLLEAVRQQESIVSVTDLPDKAGYAVLFTSGKTIYLYNGVNGKDSSDGHNPVISVRLDSDGTYYWTLDGEWLIVDGKKVKAVGTDGKDGKDGKDGVDGSDGAAGKDGKDGVDGSDGAAGKDGITPQLKIEDGFWYITYDDGKSWSKLGKAVGEDGKDGIDGKDGKDGADGDGSENFFKSVTVEDGYVVFVLNDQDQTTIKLPMTGTAASITGLKYVPEYSDGCIRVPYNTKGTDIVPVGFSVRFEVLPSSAAAYVAEHWKTVLSAKAVYTNPVTKASAGNFATMTVTDVKAEKGVVSVELSAAGLSENFFKSDGRNDLSASLFVKIADGGNEVSSDYIPLVPMFKEAEKLDIPGSVADAVDLGLSVDWASWNVGAKSEFEEGGLYGWGDPTGKRSTMNLDDYPSPFPPVSISGGEYDIATSMWGDNWRIPTSKEWSELSANCNRVIGSSYGVKYVKFVSKKNGNFIYLPYLPSKYTLDKYYRYGDYWSGDLSEEDNTMAKTFFFTDESGNYLDIQSRNRTYRKMVRPVWHKIISTTTNATNVTGKSATLNGSVYGVKDKVEVGFYYGTSKKANVKDYDHKVSAKANSTYSLDVQGLVTGTTYYFVAYAKDGEKEVYGEVLSFTPENKYAIGDYYPSRENREGIVFQVDATGKHGKIVAIDGRSVASWCGSTFATSDNCLNEYDGSKNILPSYSPISKYMREKGEGWYLPAKRELQTICESREEVAPSLNILSERYWSFSQDCWLASSTEYSSTAWDLVYIVNMSLGSHKVGNVTYHPGSAVYRSKTSGFSVVLIKKF